MCYPILWSDAMKTGEICSKVTVQHVGNCVSHMKIYELVQRYKEGRSSLVVACSGRKSAIQFVGIEESIRT
jgi:hypothetical protein